MVTLKDVAAKAGVSTAAASKALQDYPDISDATKARIKLIAAEMEYRPNQMARAFRKQKTYNIGTIYGFEGNGALTHNFFSNVLNVFCNALEREGYDLTYVSSKVGQRQSSFLDHCVMKRFEGLLLACLDFNNPAIIELTESDIPFVGIDCAFKNGVCVSSDHYAGMKELLNYCFETGHQNITFIHGQDGYATGIRKRAFLDIMKERGVPVTACRLIEGEYYSLERTEEIFNRLLDLSERPACVIFPDDYCAATALKRAKQRGVSIPGDISIASFDSADFSALISPVITTVAQDSELIGKLAARNLLDLIAGKTGSREVTVPIKLIRGESVRTIKK